MTDAPNIDHEVIVTIGSHEHSVLVGMLVGAVESAERDGRSGPWVSTVKALLDKCDNFRSNFPNPRFGRVVGTAGNPRSPSRRDHWADEMKHPTGGEVFGTKVTFWSHNWGVQHAIITRSPKPSGERERFDPSEWAIVLREGGMTHVPADQLTLGWHADGAPA